MLALFGPGAGGREAIAPPSGPAAGAGERRARAATGRAARRTLQRAPQVAELIVQYFHRDARPFIPLHIRQLLVEPSLVDGHSRAPPARVRVCRPPPPRAASAPPAKAPRDSGRACSPCRRRATRPAYTHGRAYAPPATASPPPRPFAPHPRPTLRPASPPRSSARARAPARATAALALARACDCDRAPRAAQTHPPTRARLRAPRCARLGRVGRRPPPPPLVAVGARALAEACSTDGAGSASRPASRTARCTGTCGGTPRRWPGCGGGARGRGRSSSGVVGSAPARG